MDTFPARQYEQHVAFRLFHQADHCRRLTENCQGVSTTAAVQGNHCGGLLSSAGCQESRNRKQDGTPKRIPKLQKHVFCGSSDIFPFLVLWLIFNAY